MRFHDSRSEKSIRRVVGWPFPRRVQIGLLSVFVVTLIVLYARFVLDSSIDHDEVEHLHVGFRILDGLLPYRDFYQNHLPAYWLASVQFARSFPFSIDAILAARGLSASALLGCWLFGILFLNQFRGGRTLLARLVYTWIVILLAHDLQFYIARPDPLMTLFATASLCLVPPRGQIGAIRMLILGVLFGAAVSLSTKILPISLIVPSLALVHCVRDRSPWPGVRIVYYGIGVGLGVLPAALWLHYHGLFTAFYVDIWKINLAVQKQWHDSFTFLHLPAYLTACLGALTGLSSYGRAGNRDRNGPLLLVLIFTAGLLLAAITRNSSEYHYQVLLIPVALGFTLLALTAWLHIRRPAYRLVLLAALLGYPTVHTASRMARLKPDELRIPQSDLQELMNLARPGDRSCMAFSPAHPVFCRDVSTLSNQWDLFFIYNIKDPVQLKRFHGFWRDGIERTLQQPPDIFLRRDSVDIWAKAQKAGLITQAELNQINRLEPLYEARELGEIEVWVRKPE